MYIETNKHLFWECQCSRAFWTDVEVFLKEKQINITLNYKLISLSYTECSSYSNLFNFVLIYAKYYIFKNKYEKTIPIFANFLKYLKHIENVEKLIASAKDKLRQHTDKWSKLQIS
jgi:hypothetical protein